MQSSGPSSTSSTSTIRCIKTLMNRCTTERWKLRSSEGMAWDPIDATRWKETWSHHNRGTTWDTLSKMVCGQERVRGKTSGFPARRSKSRHHVCCSGSACLLRKSRPKRRRRTWRTHTALGSVARRRVKTEGRGSLDLRGDRTNIVDWVNGDSKDAGDRKDVTTNTQEHPHSLWRNEKAAFSERVGNWMRHACAGITTREKVANGENAVWISSGRVRSLRKDGCGCGVWITVHDRNERFSPCRYFVSLCILSSILLEIRDAKCCTNCWTRLLE